MRRSRLRLALYLYLLSMVLPLFLPFGETNRGEFLPGVIAFIGGALSVVEMGHNPFIFIGWSANILLIVGLVRGLTFRKSSLILSVIATILIIPLLMSSVPLEFGGLLQSPAALVWTASFVVWLIAEVFYQDRGTRAYRYQIEINGRRFSSIFPADLTPLKKILSQKRHADVLVHGSDDRSLRLHVNREFALAIYYARKSDLGLITYNNLLAKPDSQVFHSRQ